VWFVVCGLTYRYVPFVQVLRNHHSSESANVLLPAINALYRLSFDDENRAMVGLDGGIPELLWPLNNNIPSPRLHRVIGRAILKVWRISKDMAFNLHLLMTLIYIAALPRRLEQGAHSRRWWRRRYCYLHELLPRQPECHSAYGSRHELFVRQGWRGASFNKPH
jgi:hypothetical protein